MKPEMTNFSIIRVLSATIFLLFPLGSPRPAQNQQSEFERLSNQEINDGWLSLFDGKTKFGWQAMSDVDWDFSSGEIRATTGEVGLLRTSAQFDDFELQLEVKASPRTNSGIFFRTSPKPSNPAADCFELNLASRIDSPFPTGSLVGRIACEQDFDISDWTKVRVIAHGNQIQAWIGGVQSCRYKAPSGQELGRGYIGMQFNSGEVAFRKVRIKPMNVSELKIDADLSQWKTDETRQSTFSADMQTEPPELLIIGGSGQLETKQQFSNFIFSMQCRTGGSGMNGGVFFRCIPGDYMNGYESQIQNQFKDNDRSQPVDCETGGIFRRVDARLVNADDEQWFSKTIIACGPNISVWVNGLQVTDWTDRRTANPNPRQGLRLQAGSIILQGHDPKTDLRVREIRVRELNARVR